MVDSDDTEELLEDHSIRLTTEELKHLQNENEKIWLIKLKKKRSGIHGALRHGETESSNKKEAERHRKKFSDFIKAECFVNGDETGLFYKSCQIALL